MSEKDMREILAEKCGPPGRAFTNPVTWSAAIRAMQDVERRTIERCANAVEAAGPKNGPLALVTAGFTRAILALQDAPSDDTPPAKEGV